MELGTTRAERRVGSSGDAAPTRRRANIRLCRTADVLQRASRCFPVVSSASGCRWVVSTRQRWRLACSLRTVQDRRQLGRSAEHGPVPRRQFLVTPPGAGHVAAQRQCCGHRLRLFGGEGGQDAKSGELLPGSGEPHRGAGGRPRLVDRPRPQQLDDGVIDAGDTGGQVGPRWWWQSPSLTVIGDQCRVCAAVPPEG